MRRASGRRKLVVAAGVVVLLAKHGSAQTVWTGGVGDWFDPDNWSAGVPDSSTDVEINNGGTAEIESGNNAVAPELTLGENAGDSGSVLLSAGTLGSPVVVNGDVYTSYPFYDGIRGTGFFSQTGGTNDTNGIILGQFKGSTGSYAISGGTLSLSTGVIGNYGTGTFTQSAGLVDFSGEYLDVSDYPGSSGSYLLSGGTLSFTRSAAVIPSLSGIPVYSNGQTVIGREDVGEYGTFLQSGGLNSVEVLNVGLSGSYSLSSGTLSIAGYTTYLTPNPTVDQPSILPNPVQNAEKINGTLVQTGGTNVLAGTVSSFPLFGYGPIGGVYVGESSGATGSYTMSGGTLVLAPPASGDSNETPYGLLSVGDVAGSTGIFTLSGGTIVAQGTNTTESRINLYVGYDGSGSFAQSGGSITAGIVNEYIGYYGTGSFTQTGGSEGSYVQLYLGYYSGSIGSYLFSGGTLGGGRAGENVGCSGDGCFAQTGGANQADVLYLGYNTGSTGSYALSGGTLMVTYPSGVWIGGSNAGAGGVGTLNVSGTGQLVVSSTCTVYNTPGSALNQSGGSISAGALNLAGAFNQCGGSATFGQINGTGNVCISGGTTTLKSGEGLSQVGSLSVCGTGTLDITNNALAINFGSPANDPIAAIQAALVSGYNGGTWTGPGIVSSTAAAGGASPILSVGYADGNADVGTPAGANQILIMYTLAGDALLDGAVNMTDLLIVAQNYHNTGEDWAGGNFTYDPSGYVGFEDLLIVAQNFNQTLTPADSADEALGGSIVPLVAATAVKVPEPAGAGLMLGALAGLLIRRRRSLGGVPADGYPQAF